MTAKVSFMSEKPPGELQSLREEIRILRRRVLELEALDAERRQAREDLNRSEERFRHVAENALEWIWEVDPQGVYTYSSPVVEDILGYRPEDLVGKKHFYDLFCDDDRQILAETAMAAFSQKQPFREFVNLNVHRDGHAVWLSTSGVPVLDDTGQLLGYRGADTDVTDRIRFEEDLRREKERFRTVADFTYDWEYWMAPDGTLLYVSPSCERVTGYSVSDFMENTALLREIAHPEDLAMLEEHLFVQEKTEAPLAVQFRILTRHGDLRWIEHICQMAYSPDGASLGRRASNRDVTDHRRLEMERKELIEELEAKNAELERYAYTVSHELKTPLITIRGFLGRLGRGLGVVGDGGRTREYIYQLTTAASRMQQLLDDLLELSRVGRVIKPLQEVNLNALMDDVLTLLAVPLEERGIRVEVEPHMPLLYGDPTTLRQVLENLVGNAVKFMGDQHDPHVKIGTRLSGRDTVVYVRDNGMGIDPAFHEKAFGLFEKLDRKKGTGVGLALARRIVEVHGGRIWVESQGRGHGCTFCFVLGSEDDTGVKAP